MYHNIHSLCGCVLYVCVLCNCCVIFDCYWNRALLLLLKKWSFVYPSWSSNYCMQHWCQRWDLKTTMAQFNLPLPEITVDDLKCSWTCFDLIANTKEWNKQKHIAVLPGLLWGNQVDYFLEISEEKKTTLTTLKAVLAECAGLSTVPLQAAMKVMNMKQQEKQRVVDYATSLHEKAFREGPQQQTPDIPSTSAKVSDGTTAMHAWVSKYFWRGNPLFSTKLWKLPLILNLCSILMIG